MAAPAVVPSWDPPYVEGQYNTLQNIPNEMKAMIIAELYNLSRSSVNALSQVSKTFNEACAATKFSAFNLVGEELTMHQAIGAVLRRNKESGGIMRVVKNLRIATIRAKPDQGGHDYLATLQLTLINSAISLECLTMLHITANPSRSPHPVVSFRHRIAELNKTFPSLKSLKFHYSGNIGFMLLACPNLEDLSLIVTGKPLTTPGLSRVTTLTKLKRVNLVKNTGVWRTVDFDDLPVLFPQVTELALHGAIKSRSVDPATFDRSRMSSLERLAISIAPRPRQGQMIEPGPRPSAVASTFFARCSQLNCVTLLLSSHILPFSFKREVQDSDEPSSTAVPCITPHWVDGGDGGHGLTA